MSIVERNEHWHIDGDMRLSKYASYSIKVKMLPAVVYQLIKTFAK